MEKFEEQIEEKSRELVCGIVSKLLGEYRAKKIT